MSKYIQFLLVIVYGLLTITALLLVSRLAGIKPTPRSDWMVLATIVIWLLFCFSTVFWRPDIALFNMNVRKPIFEEERRLILCMHDIEKKLKETTNYKLRIQESAEINAFAIGRRTMVFSIGLMQLLNNKELTAVMAHEMGHLKSRDTTASTGFATAQFLPNLVSGLLKKGCFIAFVAAVSVLLIGFIMVILFFNSLAVFTAVVSITFYLFIMLLINRIFHFLWFLNSRFTEYRQDAFAQKLGYGPDLKSALVRVLENTPPTEVRRYFIISRSSHPIMYNRIRRIEKLEGLRK